MKLIIATFLLTMSYKFSFSQQYIMPVIKKQSFAEYFEKEVYKYFDSDLDTLGVHGSCWIKFTLTPDGRTNQLELSPGTPGQLEQVVRKIMSSTDGYWTFRSESEWFLIPFQFTLQKDGRTKGLNTDSYSLFNFFYSDLFPGRLYTFLYPVEFTSPFDAEKYSKMRLKEE